MRRRILNVELSTRPTKGFSPGRGPVLNADLNRVRRSGSGSVTACTRASTVVLLTDAWSRVLYNTGISHATADAPARRAGCAHVRPACRSVHAAAFRQIPGSSVGPR